MTAPTPEAARLRTLLEKIVDDLFVNGQGQRADRLVLTVDGPPKLDLGGWSQEAMVDRIEDMLEDDPRWSYSREGQG